MHTILPADMPLRLCFHKYPPRNLVSCHWVTRDTEGFYWVKQKEFLIPVTFAPRPGDNASASTYFIMSFKHHRSMTSPNQWLPASPSCRHDWEHVKEPEYRVGEHHNGQQIERYHISQFENDHTASMAWNALYQQVQTTPARDQRNATPNSASTSSQSTQYSQQDVSDAIGDASAQKHLLEYWPPSSPAVEQIPNSPPPECAADAFGRFRSDEFSPVPNSPGSASPLKRIGQCERADATHAEVESSSESLKAEPHALPDNVMQGQVSSPVPPQVAESSDIPAITVYGKLATSASITAESSMYSALDRCLAQPSLKRAREEDGPPPCTAPQRQKTSVATYIGVFAIGTAVGAAGTVAALISLAPV